MARPFVFPDPNDRSPNEPSVIVSSAQVLGLYNQDSGDRMVRVTEKVQKWIEQKAQENCWDEVHFAGNQCVLKVKLDMRELPSSRDAE
jgi:hypothetical protein